MPQPLFKVLKGRLTKIEMGPEKVLSRPKLALQAMSVISHMASAEAALAQLAASITAGKAYPLVDYFSNLTADSPKMAALQALAMSHLAADRLRVFNALLQLYFTAQKLRNPLAHGLWGVCERLPDALLVIDPRDSLRLTGKFDLLERQIRETGEAAKTAERQALYEQYDQLHLERMRATMVYRNKDFESIIREIRAVYGMLTSFNLVVERDHMAPIFGSEQVFQWLIRRPALRNLLARAP